MSDLDNEELEATRKLLKIDKKEKNISEIQKFKDFLKENKYSNKIKIIEKHGKVEVEVEGNLYLKGTNITTIPNNLTVGGDLDLRGTNIRTLPNNLTVGGYLDLRGTNIRTLPNNLTVGGSLDLRETNIRTLPNNLTVGGSLDLRGTNITTLPNNLTVGGSLNLRETNIITLPESLMVNMYVYRDNELPTSVKEVSKGYNKQRKYIYFDGILWGNVKSVKQRENITIYKTPLGYCAVEDDLSAHGKNLKEAIEDLTFKKLKNIGATEIMKEIKRTGKVTRLQYRAITGACRLGTEAFCKQHNIEHLEEISLEDLKRILKPSDYGAERFLKLLNEEEK